MHVVSRVNTTNIEIVKMSKFLGKEQVNFNNL